MYFLTYTYWKKATVIETTQMCFLTQVKYCKTNIKLDYYCRVPTFIRSEEEETISTLLHTQRNNETHYQARATAPLQEVVLQRIKATHNLLTNLVPQTCFKILHFYTQHYFLHMNNEG